MGEYLRLSDGKLKLGVMDDLRYVRYQELLAMAETPEGRASPDVASALKDPATLYRFPFPAEDGQSWDDIGQRDMFEPVIILNAPGIEVEHRSIVQCVKAPGHYHQVNIYLPCPYLLTSRGEPDDPTQPALCSTLPAPSIVIVGERIRQGQHRTIFGCIFCEVLLSGRSSDIELLRERNEHQVDAAILTRLTAAE